MALDDAASEAVEVRQSSRPSEEDTHSYEHDPMQSSFFTVCVKLGMKKCAPRAWAQMYVRPEVICLLYFSATLSGMAIFGVLFISGFKWFTPHSHIPVMIFLVAQSVRQSGFWMYGPPFASARQGRSLVVFVALSVLYMSVVSIAGPKSYVPYGSRIVAVIAVSVAAVTFTCAAAFGGIPADHPSEPHKTILTPLSNAFFSTLRLMDALTDLGFVRILAAQVWMPYFD